MLNFLSALGSGLGCGLGSGLGSGFITLGAGAMGATLISLTLADLLPVGGAADSKSWRIVVMFTKLESLLEDC